MSTFETLALSKHPRDAVFEAARDCLERVVRDVEDVDRMVCQRRLETDDGRVELTNVWYAKTPIPTAIQGFLKPHMLVWTDHAVWTSADHTCQWRVVSRFFPENVKCSGFTRYESTMRGQTRVVVRGEISVDPRGLVDLALARGMEEFIGTLFPSSVRRVIDCVSRHLSDAAAPIRAVSGGRSPHDDQAPSFAGRAR